MSKNKMEQIRSSIANMDSEIVKDALSIILSKESSQSNVTKHEIDTNYKNFAQAILALKNKYKFAELNLFSVEADLVYVTAGDRRILLTNKDEILNTPTNTHKQNNFEIPSNEISTEEPDSDEDSMENAFEPIQNNASRFSHLEL